MNRASPQFEPLDDSYDTVDARNKLFGGRARIVFLAIALAGGIAVAHAFDRPTPWPWIVSGIAAAGVAILLRRRPAIVYTLFVAAMFAGGGAWYNMKYYRIAPDDIASIVGEQPIAMRLTGVALRDAEMRRPAGGSMAGFDYRPASTYFPLRVDGLIGENEKVHSCTGEVYVRVEQTCPPINAGDRVTAFGMIRAPGVPQNPGQFDYAEYARSLGQAGILTVPRRDLIQITTVERTKLFNTFVRWRESLRTNAGAWLLDDLPADNPEQRALLGAILLGQRDPELDEVNESFRRTGLAHLLAISGMHLGVVVLGVIALARFMAIPERWHGLLLIIITLVYLMLIEVRMPVLRAAVMVIAAGTAMSLGRQVRISGAIALAAIALLIWRPDQLFSAGFQLSFGVVLALGTLAPIVRERWFGRRENNPMTVSAMMHEWFKTTLTASVVAWAVATPIVAFHFAFVCPLAAPLSVVALPLTAILLLVGYSKIAIASLLPSAALLLGAPLSFAAHVLLAMVTVIDEVPGSTVSVPYPSVLWALGAIVWVCAWCITGLRDKQLGRWRWSMILSLLLVIGWLYWPRFVSHHDGAVRIDMLAVGDGSCYLLRSGDKTMLFDAGSQILNIGEQVIVPALRRMNVFDIDAIIVSHANLDHFNAVIEVVDAFDVREVIITPAFERIAANDLSSSAAFLLQLLAERNVSMRSVSAGAVRTFGDAELLWLHPNDTNYDRVNDTSMVIRIDCRGRSLLLCGDVQEDAINALMKDQEDRIAVDVVELPHHGSYNDASIAFLKKIDPLIVMQSCGWLRYERDQWARELAGVDRLITARDGACFVEVSEDGMLATGRFLIPE